MNDSRLFRIKKLLKELRTGYILINDTIDAEYISGFRSSNIYLLISSLNNILFTDFRYRESAQNFCEKNTQWQFEEIKQSDFSFIKPFIRRNSIIGVQSGSLTIDQFDLLKRKTGHSKFKKLSTKLSHCIVKKEHYEIEAVRSACYIGDRALKALIPFIKIGISERQLAEMLDNLCREYGSEKPAFETIVLFGQCAANPHGKPSEKQLRRGDLILCDFGCTVKGFCSDMTRTFVMGKADNRQKNIFKTVIDAQNAALQNIRPGIKSFMIDSYARTVINNAGYKEAFGHATGHGVGLRIHEIPRISKEDKTVIEENMVLTIEPGIYIPGWGGIRVEDTIAVTNNGMELLTHFPRNLREIKL